MAALQGEGQGSVNTWAAHLGSIFGSIHLAVVLAILGTHTLQPRHVLWH